MDYAEALRRGAPRGAKARSALGSASSPPEKRLKFTPSVSNDVHPNAEAKRMTRSAPPKVKKAAVSKVELPPKPKPKPKPTPRAKGPKPKATVAVVKPALPATARQSNPLSSTALTVTDNSSVESCAAVRVSTKTAVISALSTVDTPTINAEDLPALSAAGTPTIVAAVPVTASSADAPLVGAANPVVAASADAPQAGVAKPDAFLRCGRGRVLAGFASSADPAVPASEVDEDSANGPTNSAAVDPNVAAVISYILSAPKGSGSNLLFPAAVHARLKELLPGQDLSKLIELPADFLNCSEILAPLLVDQQAPGAKSIEARFDNFIAVQRHLLAASHQDDASGQPDFAFSVALAKSFFESEGSIHGSKTTSHQCDDDNCASQSCCPKEYNFSSVETYAARLATRFPEFASTFASKEFKKYVKAGLERQQTDGRHAMQAPPILEPHAETIASEAYSAIRKYCDVFQSSKGRPRADAAFHACRDSQDLARFVIDLAIGFRAADLSATLTKDVYVSGDNADRRYTAMQRTAKVLVPAKVWSARARAGSLLDPVRALDSYLATCSRFGVPIGKLCNGRDGEPLCSPYLFPWISQDPESGYPMVTPRRPKRQAKTGSKWEKASSSQCNAWLKRMLSLLGGCVRTEYTFHGTRAVSALVALANNRSIESINQQQGWRDRSDMANRYARLVQLQCMAQQPVLRDNLADTLARDYEAFFG